MTTQVSRPSASTTPSSTDGDDAEAGPDRHPRHRPHVARPVVLVIAALLIAAAAIVAVVVSRGDRNELVAGAGTDGSAGTAAPSVAPTTLPPVHPGIRTVDFGNFVYPSNACPAFEPGPAEGFGVSNGEYRRGFDGVGPLALWRTDHEIAYGDVNGDNVEDAAVMIGCAWASGYQYGWVFAGNATNPAQPTPLALVTIDPATLEGAGLDDVLLEGVAIDGGVVKAEYAGFLPTDARCCPSRVLRTEQRWDGTAWTFATPPVAATAS